MKKWIVLAFLALFVSAGIHLYLTKRSYELMTGQAQTNVICNISEKINCDSALLSPYAKVFNIPLSSFGVGFNLILSLLLFFFLLGFFQDTYWRIMSVYLSGVIAFISLIMLAISLFANLYCPFCWFTYALSFVSLASLLWAFKKDIVETSFQENIIFYIKEKSNIFLGAFILFIAFFLHMIFMLNFGIKDDLKQFEAILMDWKQEEVFNFSKPPLLKKGSSDAKMTIVEFADFMCPSCKSVQPSLKAFLDTRKDIAFYFYVFPLDGACNDEIPYKKTGVTCLLSRATFCAEKQGKGWSIHDFIFEKQDSFLKSQFKEGGSNQILKDIIQAINLDSEKFFSCIEDPEVKQRIKEMAELGSQAKISGTPSFFVNGKLLNNFSDNLSSLLNYFYDQIH